MADGPVLRALFRGHLWATARLMPLLVGRRSFEAVLKWAPLSSSTPYRGLPAGYIVASVNRTVRHPWLMRDRRCLREGLLAHRFLRLAGFDPDLRFGVDPKSMQAPRIVGALLGLPRRRGRWSVTAFPAWWRSIVIMPTPERRTPLDRTCRLGLLRRQWAGHRHLRRAP